MSALLLPAEILDVVVSYLDMASVWILLNTCSEYRKGLHVHHQIIIGTKHLTIYENKNLLSLAYKYYPLNILKAKDLIRNATIRPYQYDKNKTAIKSLPFMIIQCSYWEEYQYMLEYFLDNMELIGVFKILNETSLESKEMIYWAIRKNYSGILKELLKNDNEDPSLKDNRAIIVASLTGSLKCAEILLKDQRVDPSDCNNQAFINACIEGNYEMAKLLLQDARVDPSDRNNKALVEASKLGYQKIVDLLLLDSRIVLQNCNK
jgi:hypothetical protein